MLHALQCYTELQRVAMLYSVLQCVAVSMSSRHLVCCSALHSVAECCCVLAVCCSVNVKQAPGGLRGTRVCHASLSTCMPSDVTGLLSRFKYLCACVYVCACVNA